MRLHRGAQLATSPGREIHLGSKGSPGTINVGKSKQVASHRKGRVTCDDISSLLHHNTSHVPLQSQHSVPPHTEPSQTSQAVHCTPSHGSHARFSNISETLPLPQLAPHPTTCLASPTYLQTPPPSIGLTRQPLGNSQPFDNSCSTNSQSPRSAPSSSNGSSIKPPLWVEGNCFKPKDKAAVNLIGDIIQARYDGVWPTYKKIPRDVSQNWWRYFKSHWDIAYEHEGAVRKLYVKKMGRRLSDMLHRARNIYDATGEIENWIPEDVFSKLLEFWESDKFLKHSKANAANRAKVKGKHTGGSRSFHDTKIMLEEELDRTVSLAEVFMFTHMKKDKRPVDDVASHVQEDFKERVPDILPYLGQKGLRIPEDLLHEANMQFVDIVGGEKNGRISGLGNLSSEYLNGSTKCSASTVALKQEVSQLSEENSKLREELSAVRESLDAERERSETSQAAMQTELARISQLVTRFISNSNV